MDEQQLEAFQELITQLLWCDSEAEVKDVVASHKGLVLWGLQEAIAQEIAILERRGKVNAVRRLQQIEQLVESEAETLENPEQFLQVVLQLVRNNKGNSELVNPFLIQHQAKLNLALLEVLPRVATTLFEQNVEQRTLVAADLGNFGNLMKQFSLGTRWLNLELSITAYQLSQQIYTYDVFPKEWATAQNSLANAYLFRIRGERAQSIEQAIIAYEQVLHIRTRKSFPKEWAETQNNLATAYRERIRGNRAENLEIAMATYEQVLQIRTREAFPKEWATTQNNLATAYLYRIRGERTENIEQAIMAYEQVLHIRTRESFPEEWATTKNNLATAYRERIRGDRAENLEIAIAIYEQALKIRTCESFPEEWAMIQNNLAIAYGERIQSNHADNIEQAINACEKALQVYTHESFPEKWAMTQNNLAIAYGERIRGDRADNIEQVINAYEQALHVYSRETFPIEWAATLNGLAIAYGNRIRGDRAENLEWAINAFKEALRVRTRETFPRDWAATQNSLANAYGNRIRGNRADNLEQAITAFEEALEVYTHEAFPQDWAMTQNNLANAYCERILGERSDSLEQAIKAYHLALKVRTFEAFPQDWAMTQNNLALAYGDRIRGDRADNIERSIAAFEQSLQVHTREAFPREWATTQNNLSIAYRNRIRDNHSDNLERAVFACEQSLQVYTRETFPREWATTQNNLAIAYSHHIEGKRAEHLERAIMACKQSLQVRTRESLPQEWAATKNNLANVYCQRIFGERTSNLKEAINAYECALKISTCETFPTECRGVACNLGNLHFDQQNWEAAVSAYNTALAAAEILYQNCLFLEGQAAELSATGVLHHRAAYAHAKNGNLPTALLTLELGRARGLSDSLARDRANLDQLQAIRPDLFDLYQTLTQQLRNLEIQQRNPETNFPDQLRQALTQTRQNLTETIATIQQVEGYETFLKPPTFDDITRALVADQAIVYITTTPAGSLALILTPDTAMHPVWLNDLAQDNLGQLVNDWFSAYNQQQSDRQTWFNAIDQGTETLWNKVMGAIVQKLTELHCSQAVLIPTGYLGFLPLHAAWTPDDRTATGKRYALDTIHFTYAPNARSLREARELSDRTPADTILAIDEPKHRYEDPANPGTYKTVGSLPNSSREIEAAIATFSAPAVLRHEQATKSAVLEKLPHINILHCSCHGSADLDTPLNSGLALTGDGESAILTLRDIFNLRLAESANSGIRLAILSACETGLPGAKTIDEVISLPTGLLQAGVAGVAASLWSVSDLSTMLLITRFYDLWRIEGLDMAQALRQAQQWLRDTTNAEKIAYFKGLLPEFSTTKMPIASADYLYKALLLENPGDRAFAHPFHWAAFSYFGV
jgi:CHAT domain-containing protein